MIEPNGFPDYRYNDREIIRAFADNSAPTYAWLVAYGVVFIDKAPDAQGGTSVGNSVPREMHSAVMDWPHMQTVTPADQIIRGDVFCSVVPHRALRLHKDFGGGFGWLGPAQ